MSLGPEATTLKIILNLPNEFFLCLSNNEIKIVALESQLNDDDRHDCNAICCFTHLVITFAVNRHDEPNATRLVLVLWIVKSLSLRRLPIHQLRTFYRLRIVVGWVAWRCHSWVNPAVEVCVRLQNLLDFH